ncbi:MAG: hypothetical protein ACQEU4_07665 [Bacillota bacterium]
MLDFLGFLLDLSSFVADRFEFWLEFTIPLVMLRRGEEKRENKKESSPGSK